MQLIAPDLLDESLGLSPAIQGVVLTAGLLLWFGGYRWHRFWIVLAVTALAGLLGLASGRATGGQVLVFGLLLAFSGGMLAMELARLVAFLVGGFAAWIAVQAVLPQAHDLSVAFLIGGLLGLLLYPLWIMTLTSFLGTLFTWYGGLGLLAMYVKLDAIALAIGKPTLLNAAVMVATLVGLLLQGWLERRRRAKDRPDDDSEGSLLDTVKNKARGKHGTGPNSHRFVRNIRDLLSLKWSDSKKAKSH